MLRRTVGNWLGRIGMPHAKKVQPPSKLVKNVYPTQEELHRRYIYDAGELIYRESGTGKRKGQSAGSISSRGYIRIKIGRSKAYSRSRLVWIYHYGHLDDRFILLHKDGDNTNDRIGNLTPVTNSTYQLLVTQKKEDIKGVFWDKNKGKWKASICFGRCHRVLGSFDTEDEARVAYLEAYERREILRGLTHSYPYSEGG